MEWLNYHHLLYFWTVAREGSVSKASASLRLAQPTISGQVKTLEDALGEKLFKRRGRNLVLTEMGQMVFRYSDEIFSLGRELLETVKGRPTFRPARLRIGLAGVVPKLIAYELLKPALALSEPVELSCIEDEADRLVAALATYSLDVVLTDAPLARGLSVLPRRRLDRCAARPWPERPRLQSLPRRVRRDVLRDESARHKVPAPLSPFTGPSTHATAHAEYHGARQPRSLVRETGHPAPPCCAVRGHGASQGLRGFWHRRVSGPDCHRSAG